MIRNHFKDTVTEEDVKNWVSVMGTPDKQMAFMTDVILEVANYVYMAEELKLDILNHVERGGK